MNEVEMVSDGLSHGEVCERGLDNVVALTIVDHIDHIDMTTIGTVFLDPRNSSCR